MIPWMEEIIQHFMLKFNSNHDGERIEQGSILMQESNNHIVRDICIHREIHSRKKCSIENCELDHNFISCLLNSDPDTESKSAKEALNTVSSESFSEHVCIKDVAKPCGSMNFSLEHEGDYFDASIDIANGGSTEKNISQRLLLIRELDSNYSHSQLYNSTGDRDEQKHNKEKMVTATSLTTLTCSQCLQFLASFLRVPCKGAILAASMVSSAGVAPHNNSHAIEAASKSVETIDQCQPPLPIVNMSRLEDKMSESLRVSSQTYDHGESGFSKLGPLSGPIACSGPTSYSNSTSLRSNSSTSTQSFGFPILPSEWNGSPARMVETDRRHLEKPRRWRTFFLCCEF